MSLPNAVATPRKTLLWLRADLRTLDNPALYYSQPTIAIFFISPQMWQDHNVSAAKVYFILRNLAMLKRCLADLNIPLIVRNLGSGGNNIKKQIFELLSISLAENITRVVANKEYEYNERRRDATVSKLLRDNVIEFTLFDDQFVIPPETINTYECSPFLLFRNYKV